MDRRVPGDRGGGRNRCKIDQHPVDGWARVPSKTDAGHGSQKSLHHPQSQAQTEIVGSRTQFDLVANKESKPAPVLHDLHPDFALSVSQGIREQSMQHLPEILSIRFNEHRGSKDQRQLSLLLLRQQLEILNDVTRQLGGIKTRGLKRQTPPTRLGHEKHLFDDMA